jgi:hypothetical protein
LLPRIRSVLALALPGLMSGSRAGLPQIALSGAGRLPVGGLGRSSWEPGFGLESFAFQPAHQLVQVGLEGFGELGVGGANRNLHFAGFFRKFHIHLGRIGACQV